MFDWALNALWGYKNPLISVFMITCSATLCFIGAKTCRLCNIFIFYTHFIISKVLFVEKKILILIWGEGW